ncbi:MAG: hypothetical protein ACLGI5_20810 [Thermoleophilia bacterium]
MAPRRTPDPAGLLYHGTSAAHFKELRDGGWQPPADRAGPYVTDDAELARRYAARAAAAHMETTGSRDGRAVVFKLRLPADEIKLDATDDTGRQFIVPAGIPASAIVGYDRHDFSSLRPGVRQTLAASTIAAAGMERMKAAPYHAFAEMLDTTGAPAADAEIPDVGRLIGAVMGIRLILNEEAKAVAYGASHGIPHWKRVAANGLRLLEAGEPGDPAVVLAFAIVHDAMRETDEPDEPGHGALAVGLARYVNGAAVDWLPDDCAREVLPTPPPFTFLSDEQLALLTRAIEEDDLGTTSTEPTIAVCLDADRLDVWRAGVKPDPRRLSTPTARRHEQSIAALRQLGERLEWAAIVKGYAEFAAERGTGAAA